MPEPRRNSVEETKLADEEALNQISHSIGLENVQIITLFRLGKPTPTKCRPLKVILNNKSQRKYLLDNSKFIKQKAPVGLKQTIIVRDLTPEQRQERRNRLANRVRTENNGLLEEAGASPVVSQPINMEVSNNLSPITPVNHLMSSTHLSHLNHNTDSQPVHNESTIYNETTVIDRTVLGGISQENYPTEPKSPDIHANDSL